MRFRHLLLLCLPALLLGACAKTDAPVRLDFIGTSTLTSSSKVVANNDTLTTRVYAVGNDNALKRLKISVTYDPGLTPIVYPLPLASYDPTKGPARQTIVYLDSLIAPTFTGLSGAPRGGEFLFVNQFTARSTTGAESWEYTATDVKGEAATRGYRLTARKADSAYVYHSYTARLRPVPPAATVPLRSQARAFLNVRYGLLLPKYALLNQEHSLFDNQKLIDLIALTDGTAISLTSPDDAAKITLAAAAWPAANRRHTQLRRTTLTPDNFTAAATTAAFTAAFAGGTPFTDSLSTGSLAKNQVIAFRVTAQTTNSAGTLVTSIYTGLLQVTDLVFGTSPMATCAVKVQK